MYPCRRIVQGEVPLSIGIFAAMIVGLDSKLIWGRLEGLMSKLSDFYTRFPPPPEDSGPGKWQYVEDNPAPVWVADDEPSVEARPKFNWKEFRAWVAPITGVVALVSKLLGYW